MSARWIRMSLALSAVVVISFVAVSCGGDDGPAEGEASLEVDGTATVTTVDGEESVVTDSSTLAFGDVVVVDEGTATLELAAGQTFEFRAGGVDSEVVVGAPPTLRAGVGLIAGGFPAQLRYDTATVSARGPAKVSAEIPSATSYAGGARISGVGALEHLPALRSVVLTSSATPAPLEYDGSDLWDRRYLGEAIAFGQRLEALALGYTNDLQPGQRSVSFYESVIPALAEEREFGADLLGDRPTGETLVGAAITIQGREGTFRERWYEVFGFRDAGAAWGLVALAQGVSSAPVLETIELAIAESPLSGDPPAATTTTEPAPTPTTAPGPTTSVTTTTTVPTTTPPTTAPPESDGVLTPVLDPVEQILSEVLDAIGLG